MSGADTLAARLKAWVYSLPGKRGIDIPEAEYDKIFAAANGVTQQIWGRHPEPHHIQHLYDHGHHTPDAIRKMYGSLPHPYAEGLKVDEFSHYSDAYKTYIDHR